VIVGNIYLNKVKKLLDNINSIDNQYEYLKKIKKYFNKSKENKKSIELYDNNSNVQVDIDKGNFKYEKNDTVYLEFPEDKLFCI